MRLLLALAAAIGLLACHTIPLASDPTVRDHRGEVPALYRVDWWVSLVESRLWEYGPREPAAPAVDPDTQRVLVTTRDGYVRALSPLDGKVEWELKTLGTFAAGPLVQEGVAYVPGGDGTLYALQAGTGAVIWKYPAGEELAATPVLASGKVLVASSADTLYAVDAGTGKWVWQYRRDAPSGFTIRGTAAPSVQSQVAYLGFSDGWLVALNVADGSVKWERNLAGSAKQFFDVDTTPVFDESGRLFVASYQEGVYALSSQTGEVEWHTARAGVTGLMARGEVLYAVGDGQLGAIRVGDGKLLWTLSLKDRAARLPVFAGRFLAVPVGSALLFVDPSSGRAETAFDPGKGVSATPARGEGRLYVLSNLGYLYALRFKRGGG